MPKERSIDLITSECESLSSLWFLKLGWLNYPPEISFHAKGEVYRHNNLWVMWQLLICGAVAKSVLWPLRFLKLCVSITLLKYPFMPKERSIGLFFWCSNKVRIVVYWFGLHRGRVTSTWQKLRSTSQNIIPCLIWGQSVHWGPYCSTACLTLLSPFTEFKCMLTPTLLSPMSVNILFFVRYPLDKKIDHV